MCFVPGWLALGANGPNRPTIWVEMSLGIELVTDLNMFKIARIVGSLCN